MAAIKRGKKRAKRNTKEFKKSLLGRLEHIKMMKNAERRKFEQHLSGLLGR